MKKTALFLGLLLAGCGSSTVSDNQSALAPAPAPTPYVFRHVVGDAREVPPAVEATLLDSLDPDLEEGHVVLERTNLPTSANITRVPPAANQGQVNSCAAFGFGYGLATATVCRGANLDALDASNQVSPAYAYRAALATPPKDEGAYNYEILNPIVANGSAAFSRVPYTGTFAGIQAVVLGPPLQDPKFEIGSWAVVPGEGQTLLDNIKAELASGQAVAVECRLHEAFDNFSGSGVYSASGAPRSGTEHAMLATAYDDTRGAIRIQNSWGQDWGDNGGVWMAYDTFVASAYGAAIANPLTQEPLDASGFAFKGGQVSKAFQARKGNTVALVLDYRFDAPVTVRSLSVGGAGTQTLSNLVHSGQFYFKKSDGKQFLSGAQSVSLTADGLGTVSGNITLNSIPGLTEEDAGQGEVGTNNQPLTTP